MNNEACNMNVALERKQTQNKTYPLVDDPGFWHSKSLFIYKCELYRIIVLSVKDEKMIGMSTMVFVITVYRNFQ